MPDKQSDKKLSKISRVYCNPFISRNFGRNYGISVFVLEYIFLSVIENENLFSQK